MRDDTARLRDILEAIAQIEKYADRGREAFEEEELIQVWILHHLQILGEAMSALAPALQDTFPTLPWSQVIGMRNILVHHYFGVDLDVVWGVVERDLPALERQIRAILSAQSR